MDFSAVQNAMVALEKTTNAVKEKSGEALKNPGTRALWNKVFYQAEQQLLSPDGLPRRGWYRHTLYAPGFYTGYGVKTLPGVREAIEQREFEEAQQQIKILAAALEKFNQHLATLL